MESYRQLKKIVIILLFMSEESKLCIKSSLWRKFLFVEVLNKILGKKRERNAKFFSF